MFSNFPVPSHQRSAGMLWLHAAVDMMGVIIMIIQGTDQLSYTTCTERNWNWQHCSYTWRKNPGQYTRRVIDRIRTISERANYRRLEIIFF